MNLSQTFSIQRLSSTAESRYDIFKRRFDLILAVLAILLLWPLYLLVAVLVKLDSRGPVIFRQQRLGRDGRTFVLLKFRTMQACGETEFVQMLDSKPIYRRQWEQYQKLQNDPRMTRVGVFLRRFSLDELPQIINVLRGEMSLVGPRPILPEQRVQYGNAYSEYILVSPGMTGLWQVEGRNRISFAERVLWDQAYLGKRSLTQDLAILVRTMRVVLSGEGAY